MILVAMKSTIDSAYQPPAANAAGRAAPRNQRAGSVVTRGGAQQRNSGPWGQRNPLKRLDSDKEIQENPKAFLWLFMDFLGRTGLEHGSIEASDPRGRVLRPPSPEASGHDVANIRRERGLGGDAPEHRLGMTAANRLERAPRAHRGQESRGDLRIGRIEKD